MTAFTYSWNTVVATQTDADSPVDTTLMEANRQNDIFLLEYIGGVDYIPESNHTHNGLNSSLLDESAIVTTNLHVSRNEYYPLYDTGTIGNNGVTGNDVTVQTGRGTAPVASASVEEDASWILMSTGSGASSTRAFRQGVYTVNDWTDAADPITRIGFGNNWKLQIRSDNADITNTRIWAGFSNASPAGHIDDTPDTNTIAFRYSTAEGDTNWMCCTIAGTGASGTYEDSGIAFVADTEYILEIVTNPGTVDFKINGVVVKTITTTLPSATQGLGWFFFVDNITSAETKDLYFRRLSFNHSAS